MRIALLCIAALCLAPSCASTSVAPAGAVSASGAKIDPPVGKWRLRAFAGGDGAVAPEVTLIVQEDGRLAGNGGCNSYFGMWTLGAGQDTLGPVGATRRMCQPEVMEIENRYFAALSRVGGWLPTDTGLLLTDAAGDPLLTFQRD
jgi:heat shock protein HslJ